MSRFKGMKRKPHTDKVVLEDNEPQSEQATWARTQDRKTQVVRFGLFGAIGAGVLALVLVLSGFTASSPTVVKPKSTASVNIAAQAQAEDLAQQFVVTWLQAKRGAEKTLAPYVRAEGIRLPPEALFVASDARVASVEIQPAPTSPVATSGTGAPVSNTSSVYSVVVSASVRQASEPSEAAQRRFYSVPVVVNDGSARAASIPSPVPAPATGPDVNLGYKYRIVAGHPSNTAVQQFLAALTAGTGEISRYIAPGTSLRAISPAPYKSVKVVDLVSDRDFSGEAADKAPADGIKIRVLATAELSVTSTDSVTGQYPLTLTSRGGRWEVSAVDSSPLLPAPEQTTAISGAPSTPASTAPASATAPASTTPVN